MPMRRAAPLMLWQEAIPSSSPSRPGPRTACPARSTQTRRPTLQSEAQGCSTPDMGSVPPEQDLRRLDDGRHLHPGLELHLLGRGPRDDGDDLDAPYRHDHLGHHLAELDRLDGPLELVASAEHGGLREKGRPGHATALAALSPGPDNPCPAAEAPGGRTQHFRPRRATARRSLTPNSPRPRGASMP